MCTTASPEFTRGASVRPIITELGEDHPTGRGMAIIASLATNWGSEEHHGGKRVWLDLEGPYDPAG